MTTIEKIRAEIERRLSYYHPENVNHGLASGFREDGKAIAYEELLSFLDTLESEKPMQEGLEEEITRTYHDGSVADTTEMDHVDYENIARHFYELGCRHTAEKYDEIEYNRQRAEESEKPMNQDGLEEEIQRFLSNATKMDKGEWKGKYPISEMGFGVVARHFAQWGAEHFASAGKTSSGSSEIPNDLEEAALSRMRDPDMYLSDAVIDEVGDELLKMALFGAKWQKERMMKEAVEKSVCFVTSTVPGKRLEPFVGLSGDELKGYVLGDKVRIIIVKED